MSRVSRLRSLWRRNLQLRIVGITLALTAIVLSIVGAVLLNRVTNGLLATKERSSLSESSAARDEVQRLLDATDTGLGTPNTTRLVDSVITSLAVRSGTPGLYDALFLANPSLVGQPERGTTTVAETSVPPQLRQAVATTGRVAWQYAPIRYQDNSTVPGIVIGSPVTVPRVGGYELYLMFPLTAENETIGLVRRAVLTTGGVLLVGIGVLVWFVVAQITGPVRHAAQGAAALAGGDLDVRMTVRGEDDLATLGASFNEMAESLQRQIVRLEELSRIQQQFVSDVSHELRTPLTTVRMASELIFAARTTMDHDVARSAELLRTQVERFDRMLADLLEISRYDAGAAQLDASTVDLRALVGSLVEELHGIAHDGRTSLRLHAPETSVFIEADGRRISRIVRNLVVNAIEHADGKPVDITIAANDAAVSVGVRDYGHGLDYEDWDRVFSRFWRADPSRRRTLGGTGLGLAIASDDAHLHGGLIDVWGQRGKGAHFVLTLPYSASNPSPRPAIRAQVDDA